MNLVGGTALALQLGHRISVDLDFFGESLPIREQFLAELDTDATPISNQNHFFAFEIEGVKVDILRFPYPLNFPLLNVDGVQLHNSPCDAPGFYLVTARFQGSDFLPCGCLEKVFPD